MGRANAMYDTVGAEERPALWASLEGRDKLTALFLAHGATVATINIAGMYTEGYFFYVVGLAAALGLTSAGWGWWELATGVVPDDDRRVGAGADDCWLER